MLGNRHDNIKPVDSGHMDGVGYNSMDRVMTVRYKNGYEYHVHGVPPEEHRAMMDAPSQGEYYHAFIKGRYHVERVK